MDYEKFKNLENTTFIMLTKYYLEVENNYTNMCDIESGIDKNEIIRIENIMNQANCLLNSMAKNIKV